MPLPCPSWSRSSFFPLPWCMVSLLWWPSESLWHMRHSCLSACVSVQPRTFLKKMIIAWPSPLSWFSLPPFVFCSFCRLVSSLLYPFLAPACHSFAAVKAAVATGATKQNPRERYRLVESRGERHCGSRHSEKRARQTRNCCSGLAARASPSCCTVQMHGGHAFTVGICCWLQSKDCCR